LWFISLVGFSASKPTIYQAVSPDKNTRIEITVNEQKALTYRMWLANEPVLAWSSLGLDLTGVAVGQNTVVKRQRASKHTESFAWRLGENDVIHNN
jgi:hypothetical protein